MIKFLEKVRNFLSDGSEPYIKETVRILINYQQTPEKNLKELNEIGLKDEYTQKDLENLKEIFSNILKFLESSSGADIYSVRDPKTQKEIEKILLFIRNSLKMIQSELSKS